MDLQYLNAVNNDKKTVMNIFKATALWINQYKCIIHLTIIL